MTPELQDFMGHWHLNRQITDKTGIAFFEGVADFTPDGAGLHYHEQGVLTLAAGTSLRGERDYLWRDGGGGKIIVLFADGRPFHDVMPDHPQARHWCDPDDYAVRYDFTQWPQWQANWRVQGPRKDYQMVSHYTRA